MGLAGDGAGHLFIADTTNNTIRKIVLATNAVATLAGSVENPGSTDGTQEGARFNHPLGLATDDAGHVFVADYYNHSIRRITVASGAVTTLAGAAENMGYADGPGADARFYFPSSLASDGEGNLFVADQGNQIIRKIVVATGVVTTFAGSVGDPGHADGTGTAAQFRNPVGLANDGEGNLFVTDYQNQTIRKVVITTRAVTTLAGSPQNQGSEDGSGTEARFFYPSGITADGSGNLFVTDSYRHTIRKVVIATGTVTTLAGVANKPGSSDGMGSAAHFNFPGMIVSDGKGNLFIADHDNHTIRKIVVTTQAVTTLVGAANRRGVSLGPLPASLACPSGLALTQAGALLIADACENAILAAGF
jgi:hypothetical protein